MLDAYRFNVGRLPVLDEPRIFWAQLREFGAVVDSVANISVELMEAIVTSTSEDGVRWPAGWITDVGGAIRPPDDASVHAWLTRHAATALRASLLKRAFDAESAASIIEGFTFAEATSADLPAQCLALLLRLPERFDSAEQRILLVTSPKYVASPWA